MDYFFPRTPQNTQNVDIPLILVFFCCFSLVQFFCDGVGILFRLESITAMAAAVDTQYRRLCRFSPIRLSSGVNLQSGGISTFWMVPHFHTSEILMGEAYGSNMSRKWSAVPFTPLVSIMLNFMLMW